MTNNRPSTLTMTAFVLAAIALYVAVSAPILHVAAAMIA
jgi:hypothetical protein